MQDETVRSGSVIERVKSVWGRRKWLGIVVFAVPFVTAVSLVMFMPSIYRSTATILVERQQVPESMVKPTVTSQLETRLQSLSQEILSRSRLDTLIKQFNLYADLRERVSLEEVIVRMRKDIKLELKATEQKRGDRRPATTIAFTLSYDGRNPVTVANVTNTLASSYIEENLKAREKQATGTSEFLKVQLADAKRRLDEQDAVVSAFKKRHMGELPQQTDANLKTIERLNTELRTNVDGQTRAVERRASLARQMADAAAGPGGGEGLTQRRTRLEVELRALRATYSEKYPDVARLKQEIAEIDQELADPAKAKAKATSTKVSPELVRLREMHSQAENELAILKGDETRLRSALARYIGRVENAPQREQELGDLMRGYEASRDYHTSLLKRYEDAQLAESLEHRQKGEQFRVLDAAVPSAQPAAPDRMRLVLISLAACLALAVGAVVLAENFKPSFHSVDELRALTNVPVLLSIPLIVTPEDTARKARRMRLAATGVALCLVMLVGLSFFIAYGNEQLALLVSRGRA
jgi:succinoglycan biosynthesis transport protein ExoP